jgi:hypothetical protein
MTLGAGMKDGKIMGGSKYVAIMLANISRYDKRTAHTTECKEGNN